MNKKEVRTVEDIEKYYSKCRKIKFKDFEPKSLEEVFHAMNSNKHGTVYTKGAEHCSANRSRSIDDYIILSKFYFPENTVSDILKAMKTSMTISNNLTDYTGNKFVSLGYCGTIRKNNFHKTAYYNSTYVNQVDNLIMLDQGFTNCHKRFHEIY